jgi:hypothetical protein
LTNGKEKYKPLNLLGLSALLGKKPALLAKTLSCAKRSAERRQDSVGLHLYLMKLPDHTPGLPGNVISFYIVPLDPACEAGLAGHFPAKPSQA